MRGAICVREAMCERGYVSEGSLCCIFGLDEERVRHDQMKQALACSLAKELPPQCLLLEPPPSSPLSELPLSRSSRKLYRRLDMLAGRCCGKST